MKRLFLDNLGWKLLSLALAIILWITVVGDSSYFLRLIPSPIRSLFGSDQSRVVRTVPSTEAL